MIIQDWLDSALQDSANNKINSGSLKDWREIFKKGLSQKAFSKTPEFQQLLDEIDKQLVAMANMVLFAELPDANYERIAVWLLEKRAIANALESIKIASSQIIDNGVEAGKLIEVIEKEMENRLVSQD